jgi:transitional endoplasmic reticulum ATPase
MTVMSMEGREKEQKKAEKQILATLAELGGHQVGEDDLVFEGNRIVIPRSMTARSARKFLDEYIEQQEEVHAFSRTFRYRPWDGAYALMETMRELFGTTGIMKATHTMFGKRPPELISFPVSPTETTQVPWGRIELPMLEATLNSGSTRDPEAGILYRLNVECARKWQAHVEGLFKAVQDKLETHSIYRGKVINGAEQPGFIDPYVVNANQVVYTDDVTRQLDANIWSLIRYTKAQRTHGLPLKRSVLLAGPYGVGKSLGAMLTAQVANENKWTFIQCRPQDDLKATMQTAVLYQPAVVFCEDLDALASSGEQSKVVTLLDVFDGISAKGTELIMVLTTNNPEDIHKGMIRPGRLDAVVNIEALDRPSLEKLITANVPPHLLESTINYDLISEAMAGFYPAFIKESIDRAVRYAIARTSGQPDVLSTQDFVDAANGLRPQLVLMNNAGEGVKPDSLTTALQTAVAQTIEGALVMRPGEDPDEPFAQIQMDKAAKPLSLEG